MFQIQKYFLLFLFITALNATAYSFQIFDLVKNGDFEKLKVLISDNSELINSQDDFGATPLHWAGVRNKEKIAMYLINLGADVNLKEEHGGTTLHWAAHFDNTNIIRALISKGAKVNEANTMGRNALHVAARRGCLNVVKVLIELGAEIDTQTVQGQTALHIAAQGGHKEVFNLLLSEGASKEIKDQNDKIPSELFYQRPEPIQINLKNYENYTGKYERSQGGPVEISIENNKIFYISLVLDELYPISEHKFMSKSELFQISFVLNENNEVIEMKFRDRGRGFNATKVN